HDAVSALLLYRPEGAAEWSEAPMTFLVNDRWQAEFSPNSEGRHEYTVRGWVNRFLSWRRDLEKRIKAGQNVTVDLLVGAELLEEAAREASGDAAARLQDRAQRLRRPAPGEPLDHVCHDAELAELMHRWAPRRLATTYPRELAVVVDRERARCSAWYELVPRSASPEPGKHGTFKDVEARLPYVAAMGFDILYLPPIHPIGRAFRKGKNNATTAGPEDVGSPWGIGGEEGGHKAIHPKLGTLDDFRRLVAAAKDHGIEIALDVAFQCSPDHPYVSEHPEWFRMRPDGTIQYAENPPKKYQDIYPFDFETENWQALWEELKSIFVYWLEQGVKIFRVDNPHTKPFPFWEWCIGELKRDWPDVLFLSEAFTRPYIMYRLANLGFTQSFTYFAWRNTKQELMEYAHDLYETEARDFFRPNFWPNTPDILTEHLQVGGRPAFMSRLVLAATLSTNYGIYGPPFEHLWSAPREPGSEEYHNSEKYQVHYHDTNRPDSLKDFIAKVNRIRREHRALRTMEGLEFCNINNGELLAYTRTTADLSEILLVVVNLDFRYTQSGWVEVPLHELGLPEDVPYHLHDLLSDSRYLWHGKWNYVELKPHVVPAHIFRVSKRVHTERDFDSYM
ncbi:MAG: alpha-1,4-glucan--maltose-1-phosphate maltosyltransferase, partial [Planctomycetes bacterium]|nr:alpha-1,4-glucan--maltose-1-phosphate maltosyltransferase [Planctomycetota bacterium]